MELRAGQKLQSAVCDAQVVVVRAPSTRVDLGCGGALLLTDDQTSDGAATLDESLGDGPVLGKRYVDEELGLEVLCTRAGKGVLTAGDRTLVVKGAKPLPSSD